MMVAPRAGRPPPVQTGVSGCDDSCAIIRIAPHANLTTTDALTQVSSLQCFGNRFTEMRKTNQLKTATHNIEGENSGRAKR